MYKLIAEKEKHINTTACPISFDTKAGLSPIGFVGKNRVSEVVKRYNAFPELLEALQTAHDAFNALSCHEAYKGSLTEKIIINAIKKATGE